MCLALWQFFNFSAPYFAPAYEMAIAVKKIRKVMDLSLSKPMNGISHSEAYSNERAT